MIPKIKKHEQKSNKLKLILPVLLITLLPSLSIPKTIFNHGHVNAQTETNIDSLIEKNTTNSAQILDITSQTKLQATKQKDSLKNKLIQEIDSYIDKIAPKSRLRGIIIADKCLEHNIEPAFVLAQSQIECHFGTTGSARKTNSAWNVGAYDGKSIQWMAQHGFTYNHPDESLEPYIRLLKKRYLVNGKTIHHLMRNYVSAGGYRYASSKSYEAELKKTYNYIHKNTRINKLYNEIKKES